MGKSDTTKYVIALTVGLVFAAAVRFFPLAKAAYVVCPFVYLPCFLYVSRNMSKGIHFALWSIFWCVAFVIRYWGILSPYSLGVSVLLQFVAAITFSIPFWVDYFTCKNLPKYKFIYVLAFPLAYAAVDYILELFVLGSQFSLAQTQFDNKPLLQLASVFGSKGIVFALALFASLVVYYRKNWKKILIVVAAFALIHVCGQIRINKNAPIINSADNITIGWSAEMVTDDSFFGEDRSDDGNIKDNVAGLASAISEAKEKEVDLLCFPEESFYLEVSYMEEFVASAQELASKYDINILLPIEADNPDDEDALGINRCLFINSDGEILSDYYKAMLIPAAEDPFYVDGSEKLPKVNVNINGRDLCISYAICFDGDFPSYIRTMPDGTDLFIDISWDWDEVDELHARIIGLRAVENGTTVFKPTVCGYTAVYDYIGTVHSVTHSDDTGYTGVNLVKIPLAKCGTMYHNAGKVIDLIYLAGFIAILIALAIVGGKKWKTNRAKNH